jgi:DNA polymerase elongation subunit (family B)
LGDEVFNKLSDDEIINAIKNISAFIENHVNDKSYQEMQRIVYNSAETEFKVKFKQEIIAKSVLFVKKKKYSCWIVDNEGIPTDRVKTTGLEIVRSDTPEMVRPMLKSIMDMILKGKSDKEISDTIEQYKKDLSTAPPEAISTNVGIHDTKKYIREDKCIKGTPMHVKSVVNYRNLLNQLNLQKKYEDIIDGTKVKVVYLMKNSFNYETMAFLRWPKEFDKVIQIDYKTQIEKVFLNKCEMLLDVLGKSNLLHSKAKSSLKLFFK